MMEMLLGLTLGFVAGVFASENGLVTSRQMKDTASRTINHVREFGFPDRVRKRAKHERRRRRKS